MNARGTFRIDSLLDEKTIRLVFVASLWLKGAFALTEILGGIAAYFVTQKFLVGVASAVTQGDSQKTPTTWLQIICCIRRRVFRSARNISPLLICLATGSSNCGLLPGCCDGGSGTIQRR